jgi:ATP sulfurylase
MCRGEKGQDFFLESQDYPQQENNNLELPSDAYFIMVLNFDGFLSTVSRFHNKNDLQLLVKTHKLK